MLSNRTVFFPCSLLDINASPEIPHTFSLTTTLNPLTTKTWKNAVPIKDKLYFNFVTWVCCN